MTEEVKYIITIAMGLCDAPPAPRKRRNKTEPPAIAVGNVKALARAADAIPKGAS